MSETMQGAAEQVARGWLEQGGTLRGTLDAVEAGQLPTQEDLEYVAAQIGRDLDRDDRREVAALMRAWLEDPARSCGVCGSEALAHRCDGR